MDSGRNFGNLSNDDVVSNFFKKSNNLYPGLNAPKTCKISELKSLVLSSYGLTDVFSDHGMPCEVLQLSKGRWKKGRIRLRLEFCSDDPEDLLTSTQNENNQPESPLDEIRKLMVDEG